MIRPTSENQIASFRAGRVPSVEFVRDDVWAVGMGMPGGHIPYSLLYLVHDENHAWHIIDPGWDSDDNWTALLGALDSIGARMHDIRSITATHLHPDHIGMASRLQHATGAELRVHHAEALALDHGAASPAVIGDQLERWGVPAPRQEELRRFVEDAPEVPAISVDSTVGDGEVLDIPGFELVVMHTPGHTPGHISLREDARSLMFTGDHVLPTIHAGIGLGGVTRSNPLADYLHSLQRMAQFADHEVLPGHGYRFTGLATRAKASAEHHLRRSREVALILDETPDATTWQIASQLTWTAGWENLSGFYVYSALSQTDVHRGFVAGGGLDIRDE